MWICFCRASGPLYGLEPSLPALDAGYMCLASACLPAAPVETRAWLVPCLCLFPALGLCWIRALNDGSGEQYDWEVRMGHWEDKCGVASEVWELETCSGVLMLIPSGNCLPTPDVARRFLAIGKSCNLPPHCSRDPVSACVDRVTLLGVLLCPWCCLPCLRTFSAMLLPSWVLACWQPRKEWAVSE